MTRPLRNFAVERRTEKLLERDKLAAAPWHESTVRVVEQMKKGSIAHCEILEHLT